jgi:hypothetical protein
MVDNPSVMLSVGNYFCSISDELLGLDLNKIVSSDEPHAWVLPGLDLNLDFEAFLATVIVPPPTQQAPPSVELTPEEISSFIIPPPPASGNDSLNVSSSMFEL